MKMRPDPVSSFGIQSIDLNNYEVLKIFDFSLLVREFVNCINSGCDDAEATKTMYKKGYGRNGTAVDFS